MLELFTLKFFIEMLVYAFIGILGAFAKEIYTSIKKEQPLKWKNTNKKSIVIGGLLTAITMPTLEKYLANMIYGELFLLISFIMGVVSVELFSNISTLTNLKKAYKEMKDMKDTLSKLKIPHDDETKNQEGKDDS